MNCAFLRTRLAPSPTGALHLGHARTFLITWWMARQANAQILMRMEDLDSGRRKEESIEQAYADLRWLGLDWGTAEHPPQKPVVQSTRLNIYAEMLQQLWQRDLIYPCTCTRAEIVAAVNASVGAPHEGDGQIRYPGTCSHRHRLQDEPFQIAAQRIEHDTGKRACWRFRVPSGPVPFLDLIAGPAAYDVSQESGDFPLTRFEGPPPSPAYQLACVADDHGLDIDCVIRGDDLLSSTSRQLLLYHAVHWQPPVFAHVPLVVGTDGKRLAKRHGESRIAQFRDLGTPPEKVVGWAAWRSGMIDRPRPLTALEALPLFRLEKLPRHRITLTEEDLAWLSIS